LRGGAEAGRKRNRIHEKDGVVEISVPGTIQYEELKEDGDGDGKNLGTG